MREPLTVAAFCMGDRGHFQRVRPIVTALAARGARVHVFTDRAFAADVARAGGVIEDLFAGRDVDSVDPESWPPPVRYTTFAGRHAGEVTAMAGAIRPRLVVHDTFAVIGAVVAHGLGLPHVNICAGHAVVPQRFLEIVRRHPRMKVSSACLREVDRLRARGFSAASPFGYITGFSEHLNVYCEPPEFLPAADQAAFEPVAFFGCVGEEWLAPAAGPPHGELFGAGCGARRVYISFGTVIWQTRGVEALAALEPLVRTLSADGGTRVLVSLGGAAVPQEARRLLRRPGVVVSDYVDQRLALAQADVFVTHHGLNSTHEAIASLVPMVSYPFIWDQPDLAATCQRLGLAEPLADTVMGTVTEADVTRAFDAIRSEPARRSEALAAARSWELAVAARRSAVVDRIVALAG